MRKNREMKLYMGIAFAVPLLFLTIAFAICEVYPFGGRSAYIVDGVNQYLPFFVDLRRKLQTGSSLFYSFSGGLGFNYWGVIAYYLSSPLNILFLLCPKGFENEMCTLLIMLKVASSGALMSYYLMIRGNVGRPREEWRAPGRSRGCLAASIGIMYALSNYVLGFYSNHMWMDCIMLLPLIVLGIEKIVLEEKGIWYGATLFLAIFANYYIGFMVCYFAVGYFLVQCFIHHSGGIKRFLLRCKTFAIYSLVAGGMSAVLLLPTIYALGMTKTADDTGIVWSLETYGSIAKQFAGHFFMTAPSVISTDRGELNIYCGLAVILFLLIFLINKRVSLREKIGMTVLAVVLFLGFHFDVWNFILHGLHKPIGFQNRFSFLYIFLVLQMSYTGVARLKQCNTRWIIGVSVLALGIVLVLGGYYKLTWWYVLVNGCLMAVWALFCYFYRVGKLRKKPFFGIFLLLISVELGVNCAWGIAQYGSVNRNFYYEKSDQIWTAINRDPEDGFYRMEILEPDLADEVILYGGKGLAYYSSTVPERMQDFLIKMGFESSLNKYRYKGSTGAMDMILGIQYVAAKDGAGKELAYPVRGTDQRMTVYENRNSMGVGFLCPNSVQEWNVNQVNPFDVQNELFQRLSGENIYRTQSVKLSQRTESIVVKLKKGEHLYFYVKSNSNVTITEKITDGSDKTRGLIIQTDSKKKPRNCILNMGKAKKATEVTLTISGNLVGGNAYCYVGVCDDKKLNTIYDDLSSKKFNLERYGDSWLEGTVTAEEDEMLLLSVPYEEGWEAQVDGEKTETIAVGGGLLGVPLTAGTHQVTVKYHVPGFLPGLLVSILFAGVFALCIIFERRRKPVYWRNSFHRTIRREDFTNLILELENSSENSEAEELWQGELDQGESDQVESKLVELEQAEPEQAEAKQVEPEQADS